MIRYCIILLAIFSPLLSGAQYHYLFSSQPDSAEVYLNDELRCYTPCKVKYFWRENQDGVIEFKVSKAGYKDWENRISKKPLDFNDRDRVYLDQDFPLLDFQDPPLISFDKLIVKFPEGKKIGKKEYLKEPDEEIEWKGSFRIGDEKFTELFMEVATNMGFKTPLSVYGELFSQHNDEMQQLPRFIIGVQLTDININYREVKTKKDYSPILTDLDFTFEWNVLDKKSDQVILSKKTRENYRLRQDLYSNFLPIDEVFETNLIAFLKSDDFIKLIEDSDDIVAQKIESSEKAKSISIENTDLKPFDSFGEMVKNATKSCVTILTDRGHGSGTLIDPKGVILSAYHVVQGVNKIEVKLSSGLSMPAEILSFDAKSDLVLLKLNGSGYPSLPLAAKFNYELGEEVSTIGTPAEVELGQSLSKGIVSGKRKVEDEIYLQLDMAVSPGNSGGPLLNSKGQVIGVVLRKIIHEGVEGIGFAVPMDVVIEELGIEFE